MQNDVNTGPSTTERLPDTLRLGTQYLEVKWSPRSRDAPIPFFVARKYVLYLVDLAEPTSRDQRSAEQRQKRDDDTEALGVLRCAIRNSRRGCSR